jgi:hypothetical protein
VRTLHQPLEMTLVVLHPLRSHEVKALIRMMGNMEKMVKDIDERTKYALT